MSEENKAVVVVGTGGAGNTNALATVLPAVFKDVDFSTLNATIDALGKNSKILDKDEKQAAAEIVDDWKKNVVSRLKRHDTEMREVVTFFTVNRNFQWHNAFSDDEIAALAGATQTEDLYQAVIETKQAMDDYRELYTPEAPTFDDSVAPIDKLKMRNDYEYKASLYNIEYAKLERKNNLAWKAFIKALNEKEQVKELLTKATKYIRSVNKLIDECDAKTQLAKLNIQISSDDVRQSLRDLMAFTVSI